MNAPTVDAQPTGATLRTGEAQRATRGRRWMLGALALGAGLVIGAAWWLGGTASVPWAPTGSGTARQSSVASTPRVSVSAAASATTAASQPSPRMSIPEEAADTATADLALLMHARDELLQTDQDMALRLDRIESELGGLRRQIETRLAADGLAAKKARANLASRPIARSTKAAPHTPEPRVLGVDSWNGRPSVSILVGADVRFVAEGDVVGSSYVKRADPANQRVDFVSAGGAAATAVSALGSER